MPTVKPGEKFTIPKMNSVYVGNVPEFYNEKLMKDMFSVFGAIKKISILPLQMAHSRRAHPRNEFRGRGGFRGGRGGRMIEAAPVEEENKTDF